MVHVTVRFRNGTKKGVSVTVDPVIPKLTPLSVSDPGDRFDPGDPWFEPLGGKAFNRAYGLVMSSVNDPLPSMSHGIWIRRVSASPGLEVYSYRRRPNAEFEGILGTGGCSEAWGWNLTMFHPCFVGPAEAGQVSATFEAFLADERTGEPVPGYTAGAFTLVFNTLPELRVLAVQPGPAGHEIRWTTPYANRFYQVQWRTNVAQAFRPLSGDLKPPQDHYTNVLTTFPPEVFYRVIMK
jgi:hypothetical protein